jgi:integrase
MKLQALFCLLDLRGFEPRGDRSMAAWWQDDLILPDIRDHLSSQVRPELEALVFTSPTGTLLRHSNFRKRVCLSALAVTGLTGVHFHDLRHAGNLLIAHAGANLRELMDRLGHSSSRAAGGTRTPDRLLRR